MRMISYWKSETKKAREALGESEETRENVRKQQQELHQTALGALTEQIHLFENTVQVLEEELQTATQESKQIKTMHNGKYTDEVRQCCMSLLSHNVGTEHISDVIRSVLQLANVTAERLPSLTLLKQILLEGRAVSLMQVGEAAMKDNNTLHYDGTSKFGKKYGSFQLSTNDQQFTVSVNDVFSGSAEHSLELLKVCMQQVDQACAQTGSKSVAAKLISSIKNTMSDRAATNLKFNTLLDNYRRDLLPSITENWSAMTDEEHAAVAKVNHHFCGLHLVVNLAEQCNAVLSEWEKTSLSTQPNTRQGATALPGSTQRGESGTLRLVRTACKSFQKHGSEQSGRMDEFAAFCQSKGIETVPLASYRGNRFNIIFFNAAGVYFLAPLMVEFLSVRATNRLLQAVQADLAVPEFVAGCRALGLIGKYITAPLWRHLVDGNVPFHEVIPTYQGWASSIAAFAEDPTPFLDGTAVPFPGAKINRTSAILDKLLEPADSDDAVAEILKLLCLCFHRYMHKAWACYLEGGNNTAVAEAETASLKKVNVISERDFAQLDRFVREKPNATSLAIESFIMLGNNKTAQWLSTKPEEERGAILQAAWTLVPKHKEMAKERRLAIQKHKLAELEKQKLEAAKREQRRLQETQKITAALATVSGLWVTEQQATSVLDGMATTKKKIEAIKCQVRFRNKVMRQEASKDVFAFSKQGKALTLHELTENLLSLIRSVHNPATNLTDAAGSESEGDDSSSPCSEPPPTTQTDTALRRTPRTTDPTTCSSNYTPPSTEDYSSSPCPELPNSELSSNYTPPKTTPRHHVQNFRQPHRQARLCAKLREQPTPQRAARTPCHRRPSLLSFSPESSVVPGFSRGSCAKAGGKEVQKAAMLAP